MAVVSGTAHGAGPAPKARRKMRVPRALAALDVVVLALLLLSPLGAPIAFGATRFHLAAPFILTVCLALVLFGVRVAAFPSVRRLHVPPGTIWGLAFLAYAAVRIPFAASPYEARIEVFTIAAALGAYFALADVAGAGRRWRIALALLLVVLTLIAWYMIVLHARESRSVLHLVRPEGYGMRASGTYGCPNHVAQILAVGMTLGLALLFMADAGWPLRLLGAYALALPVYPLVLTQSRAGMIGAAAGLGTTGFLMAWRRGARWALVAILAIPLLLGAAGWALWSFSPPNRERMARAMRWEDSRIDMWRTAAGVIQERPWLGHGGDSFRYVQGPHQTYRGVARARYAHNEFLHLAADHGLVGFALFALFFGTGAVRVLARLRRMRRDRDAFLAAALLGVLAGSLAHNFFDFTFHLYGNIMVFVLVAGTVMAVLFGSGELTPRYPRLPWRRVAGGAIGLGAVGLGVWVARSFVAVLLLQQGVRAQERSENRRADALFERAGRLDPGHWGPVVRRADLLRRQAFWNPDPAMRAEMIEEAEARYREALELNPWLIDAYDGLHQLYRSAGDDERALAELQAIIERAPVLAQHHVALGLQLRRMGRLEEALAAFNEALRQDPSDPVARANRNSLRRRGVR